MATEPTATNEEPTGDPIAKHFGRNLKDLRKKSDWSQSELATFMQSRGYDWHQNTVSRIEANERPVTISEAVVLANVFSGGRLDDMVMPPEKLQIVNELADALEHIDKVFHDAAAQMANLIESRKDLEKKLKAAADANVYRARTRDEKRESLTAAARRALGEYTPDAAWRKAMHTARSSF